MQVSVCRTVLPAWKGLQNKGKDTKYPVFRVFSSFFFFFCLFRSFPQHQFKVLLQIAVH